MSTSENNVYVLMRTKFQFCFPWLLKKRYRFFRDAVESVMRQQQEYNVRKKSFKLKLNLIILQDSWWRISDNPRMRRIPAYLRKILGESPIEVFFYSCNSRGAAQSLYNIREVLFRLSANDDDIAVMLDDDDMFAYSGAVGKIMGYMATKSAEVCVTQFETIGQVSMNIVNRGGERHRQLVKQKKLQASLKKPYGKGSLCFADSLGWTKAYRVGILKEYHRDLRSCFKTECELRKFIRRNDAFEDFPEIINLCRKEVKVVGLNKVTHAYRKHKGSITAKPSKKAFVRKRPAYLALLMKLYCRLSKQERLKQGAICVITRYMVVKILTIENILAKYRSDESLKWSLSRFEKGDFMRLMLSDLREEGVLDEFIQMLAEVEYLQINGNYNTEYDEVSKEIGDADSEFMKLYRACRNEAINGVVDLSNVMCDKPVRHRVNLFRQYNYRNIAISLAYLGLIPFLSAILKYIGSDVDVDVDVAQIKIALLVPFAGWLYTVYRRGRDNANARKEATERFCDYVNELCRHIEAGLCVLYNIKCRMDADPTYRPAMIHFTNLKVLSQLSSSEFDSNMIIDEFSSLPELRVNIRNIDNSAEYMAEYVTLPGYSAAKMKEIIEWEIVRYISYIARLKFFTYQKSFILPSVSQLILFVRFADIVKEISKTIKVDGKTEDAIRNDMQSYYKRYLEDRKVRREIL